MINFLAASVQEKRSIAKMVPKSQNCVMTRMMKLGHADTDKSEYTTADRL